MLYLDEEDLLAVSLNWDELMAVVEDASRAVHEGDFSQPIKPYLRFGDPANRIIAMPAYVGGKTSRAGIKWIASFPANLARGLARASSVTVINNAETGQPVAIINSAIVSAVRTAAVSGVVVSRYLRSRAEKSLRVGIIGWGPIGQYHAMMVQSLLHDRSFELNVYDIRELEYIPRVSSTVPAVTKVSRWQDAFVDHDIVFTCTVSSAPYIDLPARTGSLLMNISLRDYVKPFGYEIIVDDWDEVCRENTDIERFSRDFGLTRSRTKSLAQVVIEEALPRDLKSNTYMFNPMGMAVFDVAIAGYYVDRAHELGVGTSL